MNKKSNKKKQKKKGKGGDGRNKENFSDVQDVKDGGHVEESDAAQEKACYEVKVSDVMGRYVIATRDIQPGEVIIEEPAIAVGPCTGCGLICLGCYRELDDTSLAKYKLINRCPGCKWPLCSSSCPGVGKYTGHSTYECETLKKITPDYNKLEDLKDSYQALMPLRCLLLKKSDPEKWRALSTMEAHNEVRRARGDIWPVNEKHVVQRIKKWGLDYDPEEIHTVCGILEVNAFEVGGSGASARALYDRAFLLAHECTPSTTHTDADRAPGRPLTVRASIAHKAGDLISLCYAYTLQGTLKRREHIKHSKFFDCSCKRCSDPTELETYASAFRCPVCGGRVVSRAPLDARATWACLAARCGYTMPAAAVQLLLKRLTDEYEAIDVNDVPGYESFLHKYRNVVQGSHYLCLSAKHSLSQLYGKVTDYMIHEMPDLELNRKIDICRELMKVFDVIEPGYSRLRGVTLYELHAPLMILTTRDFEKKAITKESLRTRLKEKMVDQGSCIVCLSPAIQKCSGCQIVHYCSKEHQKQDWKQHKFQCSPARVKEDEKFGRYLEATRDLKPGDVVIKEKPLITGPSQVTPPVCLGCYKLLEEGKTVTCDKCGWPFCSQDCTNKEEHKPECHYTEKRGEKVNITTFGIPHPNYQCITVLRCLYQRDQDQKLWEKLQALQSHCEDRQGTDKWNSDKKMVANFIWKFFKLEGTFSEEEIMRCCGILQINGHEVPLLEPEYVAVYDRISMVEHNCRANCNKSFTSNGDIILSAGIDITSGSHITVCYTDPLWGTEARRHHLADSKFFECTCERCSDVTELGTMYSAVKCKKKDCKGYILPETFIHPILEKTKNPNPETRNLDNKFWICNKCKDSVSDAIIQQLVQDIGRELSVMPKEDADACERFINHCSSYLHPNHFYMVDVSLALAQMVGQEQEQGLALVSDDRLLLKTHLCRKITDLLDTLAPAETRLRGSLLFELHAAVAETGRRESLKDGPMVLLGYVNEARKILMESATLLRHEPPELPEGSLYRQARINLVQMDELIRNLSAALPSPL